MLRGSSWKHRRGQRSLAEVTVNEGKRHPGVGGIGSVHGDPGGEGRQSHLRTGFLLPSQKAAVGTGAEPPLDEQMQAGEVGREFQSGVGVDAVSTSTVAAAWLVRYIKGAVQRDGSGRN